ncbi:MAG: hypothetical protein AAB320_03570 [Elusimicrobiota bacterium]
MSLIILWSGLGVHAGIVQAGSTNLQTKAVLAVFEAAKKAGFSATENPPLSDIKAVTGRQIMPPSEASGKGTLTSTLRGLKDNELPAGEKIPRVRMSAGDLEALKVKRGGAFRFADGFLITVRARNNSSATISLYRDGILQWSAVPPGELRDMFTTRAPHTFQACDDSGRQGCNDPLSVDWTNATELDWYEYTVGDSR